MIDDELERVVSKLLELDPDGSRTGMVLRRTLDQLYDGQHTGRYRWDQLYKTEKTHCGTLVEINLHREFGFGNGLLMDYVIAGVEVDCKYSQSLGGWMIPPESLGHLCLLISADDEDGKWHLGVVRVVEGVLSEGRNRDGKRSITTSGRDRVRWLFTGAMLPPNVLLRLPAADVQRIFSLSSGQRRIDEVFRLAQGERIGRGVIATLGQQEDYMKRVRSNGGSRSRLRSEGIIILSGDFVDQREVAAKLGVAVPHAGEFVSVRVAPASPGDGAAVELDGCRWRVASADDPVAPAPRYPRGRAPGARY